MLTLTGAFGGVVSRTALSFAVSPLLPALSIICAVTVNFAPSAGAGSLIPTSSRLIWAGVNTILTLSSLISSCPMSPIPSPITIVGLAGAVVSLVIFVVTSSLSLPEGSLMVATTSNFSPSFGAGILTITSFLSRSS